MIKKIIILCGLFLMLIVISSCGKMVGYSHDISTRLQSTTLSTQAINGYSPLTEKNGSVYLTPSNISGMLLSGIFTLVEYDYGVVFIGNYRPDLAPANSSLIPFDLSQRTVVKDSVSYPPWFTSGTCDTPIMLFGYFDTKFTLNSAEKIVRFCYGDTDPYKRGDKLLYFKDEGKFKWLDLDTNTFTDTRPTNPSVNTFVHDFKDPTHGDVHYFGLGARLTSLLPLSAIEFETNHVTLTMDFNYLEAIVLEKTKESELAALSDINLIKNFNMTSAVSWENPGITVTVVKEVTSR